MTPHVDSARQWVVVPAKLEEIVDLRWMVLLPNSPRQAVIFPGDEAGTSLHLAAKRGPQVIGCLTLHQSQLDGAAAWQLRGMAVQQDCRGLGVGRSLLEGLDALLRQRRATLGLWCNAQAAAVGFYRRMGWSVISGEFEIKPAGPHFKMSRLAASPQSGGTP